MIQLLPDHLIADEAHQRLVLVARTRERRERIATAVMAGLCSRDAVSLFTEIARAAAYAADALIAELDKQP